MRRPRLSAHCNRFQIRVLAPRNEPSVAASRRKADVAKGESGFSRDFFLPDLIVSCNGEDFLARVSLRLSSLLSVDQGKKSRFL